MAKQRVLKLTIKRQWFDMIITGEKIEEYREIKPHWINRLYEADGITPIPYDLIEFSNGYDPARAPEATLEYKGFSVGYAKKEWSNNWQGQCFVIRLGNLIEIKNVPEPRLIELVKKK